MLQFSAKGESVKVKTLFYEALLMLVSLNYHGDQNYLRALRRHGSCELVTLRGLREHRAVLVVSSRAQ